ncbi:NlpC/P60 family protein [Rapidithrix thailandica]|uniref:NlpC/P60 family protein n=1 Tax=Rapidithrix thailandica TaxID=413964 RepID=A0AAW9SI21_9BACT
MINASCKSKKYISEIPYKFKFDRDQIEYALSIKKNLNEDSIIQEYEEDLTERELYLKEKYSIILQVKPSEIKNYPFYDFIDQKIGKPYISGEDLEGVSMAFFVQDLFEYTYKAKLPSTPLDIFNSAEVKLFMGRPYLEEGDLIFLRYNKDNPISDVIVYLKNGKIVATNPKGVLSIYNFSEEYFQKRYLVSGRLKTSDDE